MTRGLLALCVLAGLGCDHDLGEDAVGQSIRGTLTYEGTAAQDFEDPAWFVIATTALDPDVVPHALTVIRTADLTPTAYELRFLPAGRYFLVAQLVDLDDFDPVTAPIGAFPNGCILTSMPEGRSLEITEDVDRDAVDMIVRDGTFADPCFRDDVDVTLDPCPNAGRMAVSLRLESSEAPAAGDRIVLALAPSFPPAEDETRSVRSDLAFPFLAGFNEQEPGDYVVYACLDRGSDAPDGLCGDGDLLAMSDAITFAGDFVHEVTVDLDAGTVSLEESVAPDPVACAPSSTLRVRVTAPDLVPPPGPEDILAVTLFDDFPSMRTPDFTSQRMGVSFPTMIEVPADPGDYFAIVCFQRADSPRDDCMGPEDRVAFYMGLGDEVELIEGETTVIDVELSE
ncbi:MAG: hypothetical protein AAGE52_40860 [Myxococcota bacterium]